MFKEIKDFLNKEDLLNIKNLYMNKEFSHWRLIEYQEGIEDQEFLMHDLYWNFNIVSPFWKTTLPLINKLNVNALVQARVNCMLKKDKHYRSSFHTDTPFECGTAIYYLNTTNGWTEFETGEKVKTEENKLIIFNSSQKHAAVHQTDEQKRYVININFF